MKYYFILISLISNLIFSQDSNVKIYESEEYPAKIKEDSIQSFYSFKNGNIGILRVRSKEILVDIFNSTLERRQSLSIKKKAKETFVGSFSYNQEIRVFTESYPKRNIRVINCYNLNTSTKSKEVKEVLRLKIDNKLTLFSNKKFTSIKASSNLEHFSIVSYIIHAGEIYFDINVFNSKNFKLDFNQNFKRNENRKYIISDIIVSDDKEIVIIGKSSFDDKNPEIIDQKNSSYFIDRITSSQTKKLKIKPTRTMKPFIIDNTLKFYGMLDFFEIGIPEMKINKSSDIKNKVINIYEKLTQNKKRKKEKKLVNFYLNYAIRDQNNSIYLLAEQYYRRDYINANGGGSSQINYDNIIVLKIDKKNRLEWVKVLFKKDFKSSYKGFVDNKNKLHIIINSGKNMNYNKEDQIQVTRNILEPSSLYDIAFNAKDGSMIYKKIQDNKSKTFFSPNLGYSLNGKFILPSKLKKNSKIMILD